MTITIFLAFTAGLLVILSRQVNGRLALSSTPLVSSFWNHCVGFVFLSIVGLAMGGLIPSETSQIPLWVFSGGAFGVVFVAAGSWLLPRIGAVNSTLLVVAGQMVFGVLFDLVRGAPVTIWAAALGVVLILAGMTLMQTRR